MAKKDKYSELDNFFKFMNEQHKKLNEITQKRKINELLIDNNIKPLDYD